MASGELVPSSQGELDLPQGSVVTYSGRISAVRKVEERNPNELPFTAKSLVALDKALTEAIRTTRIRFTAYIGDLGQDSAAGADAVFPGTPDAERSVLIAVDPNHRAIEIRSGKRVSNRVDDRVAQLGITAAVGSFSEGQLIDGLIIAIRVMTAAIAKP